MDFREQLPTMTDVQQLEHMGFSSEQIAKLVRIKTLYQQEAISEHKRQAFVRWLYQQGRLQS